jgi:hypothetical protein
MKKTFLLFGGCMLLLFGGCMVLVLASLSQAAPQGSSFTGEIMDSACAKAGSHEGMMKSHAGIKDAKTCTLGCVKNGSKFVLYDASSKTVYELDDQEKPRQFAGDSVKVTGKLDRAANTIHVTDISGS